MNPVIRKILWADDEIDLLKPHILLLEEKGFRVTPVSNGNDAVACAAREKFDVVLLDESMPGMGGLATLEAIKEKDPGLPIVLVTKNEAESLMDEAIGRRIDDYLLKPVLPNQIFLALKRLLESDRLQESRRARDYVAELARLRSESAGGLDWRGWIDLYARSAQWDVELDQVDDEGLKQAQGDQRRELNVEFSSYVESHYESWVGGGEGPPMSHQVVERWVAPHLREGGRVFLLVIDCMRLDQWLTVEPLLRPYFDIELTHQISILPSATPYSRNAIFSGLLRDPAPASELLAGSLDRRAEQEPVRAPAPRSPAGPARRQASVGAQVHQNLQRRRGVPRPPEHRHVPEHPARRPRVQFPRHAHARPVRVGSSQRAGAGRVGLPVRDAVVVSPLGALRRAQVDREAELRGRGHDGSWGRAEPALGVGLREPRDLDQSPLQVRIEPGLRSEAGDPSQGPGPIPAPCGRA
jgi:CheY-like chemotaxis protein